MIKVLHYLRNLGLGGTEKTCQLFVQYANKHDFAVAVAYERTGDHTRLDAFKKAVDAVDGYLFEIDSYADPKWNGEPNEHQLQQVIDVNDVDILHVYRSGYAEFPANNVRVPHIVETNVFGFLDPSLFNIRTLFMSKWLMNYSLCGAQHPRFDFVNNPVEFPATDIRHPLVANVPKDAILLGRCGRPDNGIYNSVSVDAARLLRMQGYDVRFVVVAPPSNMIADLERYEIPYYTIQPTVDPAELSAFYNSIDIYAHARADGETYGVNIAEAMIHGKPVVTHIATPSVPGMGVFQSQTELVNDGTTGIVVQNDPAQYAEALKKLIDDKDLRFQMGDNGRLKAYRECEVGVCVEKLENIYREVVNEQD